MVWQIRHYYAVLSLFLGAIHEAGSTNHGSGTSDASWGQYSMLTPFRGLESRQYEADDDNKLVPQVAPIEHLVIQSFGKYSREPYESTCLLGEPSIPFDNPFCCATVSKTNVQWT